MELEKLIERYFPGLALKRIQKRVYLEQAKRVYSAAQTSTKRVAPTDSRSPDSVMEHAQDKVRKWARYLDENHDLAIGVLDVLVNKVVGTGITVEPQVEDTKGNLHEKFNKQIADLWKEWCKKPEITGELPFSEVQRIACRAWFRDGEILTRKLRGGRRFPHPNRSGVPYSLEMVEADYLPFQDISGYDDVIHGVQKNAYGQPIAYFLWKDHPGNYLLPYQVTNNSKVFSVPAEDMIHLKFVRRFRQTRGISIFHGVIDRLDDIKDYEESERIAARIAASLTAFIKKSSDFTGTTSSSGDREFQMQAGMIFDSLMPGEDVGMIKSDRPNPNLQNYRNGQLKAIAAGTSTTYSSISKDYDGSYSSQRQEIVEGEPGYSRLQGNFIDVWMNPVYDDFVGSATISGRLQIPRGVNVDTLFKVEMRGPGQAWIDPLKEVQADKEKIEARIVSRAQVIRQRGNDPRVVNQQIQREREEDLKNGFIPAGQSEKDSSKTNKTSQSTDSEDDGSGDGTTADEAA